MKAYDASFPLNVNFFMKNLKTLIFGATYYAKESKDSPRKRRGGFTSYKGGSYIKRKLLESRLRIYKAFWGVLKSFDRFGKKELFQNTSRRKTKL